MILKRLLLVLNFSRLAVTHETEQGNTSAYLLYLELKILVNILCYPSEFRKCLIPIPINLFPIPFIFYKLG